jgi:hypothetical protein
MKRVLAVLTVLLSCKELEFKNELKPLYISAMLVVGDTVQYIFVDRPRKPEEPRGKGFNDAYVEVSDGESTWVFMPELTVINIIGEFIPARGKDTIWLYKAKFSPKPLKLYKLKVIRGKDTVLGQTLTPDTFSFILLKINPDSTFSFINDTVNLPQDSSVLAVWKKVMEGYFYFCFVYNHDKRDSLLDYDPNRYLFVPVFDSALVGGIGDSLRAFLPFYYYRDPTFSWGSGNYAVKIWALNYDRFRWGLYNDGNLEKAEGFFGAVSQSVRVFPVRFR